MATDDIEPMTTKRTGTEPAKKFVITFEISTTAFNSLSSLRSGPQDLFCFWYAKGEAINFGTMTNSSKLNFMRCDNGSTFNINRSFGSDFGKALYYRFAVITASRFSGTCEQAKNNTNKKNQQQQRPIFGQNGEPSVNQDTEQFYPGLKIWLTYVVVFLLVCIIKSL
ncbi:hypothetical protein GQX74_007869 [Glossina fuscipes]|nr:hypothetical protein GQX74_007869 [Glossina fuscipes]